MTRRSFVTTLNELPDVFKIGIGMALMLLVGILLGVLITAGRLLIESRPVTARAFGIDAHAQSQVPPSLPRLRPTHHVGNTQCVVYEGIDKWQSIVHCPHGQGIATVAWRQS